MSCVDESNIEAVVCDGLALYDDPTGQVLGLLGYVQNEFGYIPEYALSLIADRLGVPLARLEAVCTFFRGFTTTPLGRHILVVCDGTACHMRGASEILQLLEQLLGIAEGETTADGKFSLMTTHCVGSCASAPILLIDGSDYVKVRLSDVVQMVKRVNDE